MKALRQSIALLRLLARHWMRGATTAGAAPRAAGLRALDGQRAGAAGGAPRPPGSAAALALRLAFLLLLARSFHAVADLAMQRHAERTLPWILLGPLVSAAALGTVPLLPAFRNVRDPLRSELLDALPLGAAPRVVLALARNVVGLVFVLSVCLGASRRWASPERALLLGLALYLGAGIAGVAALWLLRALAPAHRIARLSWAALVLAVGGILLVQIGPLLGSAGLVAPWAPLLRPASRALLGQGDLAPALVLPGALVALSALVIALVERRGYDRLEAPPPGRPRYAAPAGRPLTAAVVDRLVSAREAGFWLRTLVLSLPLLASLLIAGGVLWRGWHLDRKSTEVLGLAIALFAVQSGAGIALQLAGQSALRDARARALLAPLPLTPADTLEGRALRLTWIVLPAACALFPLLVVAPSGTLPLTLTRAIAVFTGMLLVARAAPPLAFLTNGLGASQPGSGLGLSAAPTLLLLLPLFSAVLAAEPWPAALSLILLALLGAAARRAGLRCLRWLDDAADDVERDTPVWRALLALGAFFGVQALVAQITSFALPGAGPGVVAGLAYVASAVALLLMTLSNRGALGLRWWPARPLWLGVGALAGVASGGAGWLYLRGIRAMGWEPPAGASLGVTEVIALAAAAVLVAPAAEEAFFRGWLQPAVGAELPARRFRLAPLLTAAVFALVHPALSFVPVLVLGVVAGELALAAGALLPGIVAHTVHNAIALLLAGG